MIYFLFPFEGYFLNTFQSLVVSSPILFGVVTNLSINVLVHYRKIVVLRKIIWERLYTNW